MWKIVGVFLFLIASILANAAFKTGKFDMAIFMPKFPEVVIGSKAFIVDVAKTEQQKEVGLSSKSALQDDHGMYFPFDHADYYSFWMKNMKFPIDIIYINNDQVVTIYHDVQNPTADNQTWQIVKPTEPADGVLEINAGLTKKYNFKPGDPVKKLNI